MRTLYGVETLTLVEALASTENVPPSQNKGPCFDTAPRSANLLNMKYVLITITFSLTRFSAVKAVWYLGCRLCSVTLPLLYRSDNCTVERMRETVHKWLVGQYRTKNRDLRLLIQEHSIWYVTNKHFSIRRFSFVQ